MSRAVRKRALLWTGAAAALGAAWFAAAQTAPPASPCADYAAAAQWDASISFNYAHVAQDANGRADLSADASGTALLARVQGPIPGISPPAWRALAQGSGFVHDIITDFTSPPPDNITRFDGAGGLQAVGTSNASIIFLDIDSIACTYTFTWTPALDVTITNGSSAGSPFVDGIGSVQSVAHPLPTVTPGQPPPPLVGNAAFAADFGFGPPGDHYVPERLLQALFLPGQLLANSPSAATVQWSFDPNVEELELVVDPKNGGISYDRWLPEGAKGPVQDPYNPAPGSPADALENKEGNVLFLDATVRRVSDHLPPQTRKVQKIEYVLTQRSSEPGIALNFPPPLALASPQPPDLKFDAAQNLALNILVPLNDSSRAEAPLQGLGSSATALLSVYDWGAFGTLEVHATLSDGKVLIGHLLSAPTVEQIPIPKRSPSSDIGDQWKIDNGVTAKADSADDEDNPGGNGTDLGDGISLYEEYRGFFVGGFHTREGQKPMDPKKKDLFVFNGSSVIGATLGFKMLEDEMFGPALRVHYELSEQEFPGDRVMNPNRGTGAHTVDQHGLKLEAEIGGLGGGQAVRAAGSAPGSTRMLPRQTAYIRINQEPRTLGVARVATKLVGRTVAHEIGHAISVMHHGDTDLRTMIWTLSSGFVEERAKGSAVGSPGSLVEVRTEPGATMTATELAAIGLAQSGDQIEVEVGNFEGEHSGNELCFMRYESMQAYTHEPRHPSTPSVRWWVGGDAAGPLADDSSDGTGTNAPTRKPRSRTGPACAAKQRGDCQHQVRVSDALPDVPYPLAAVCP